MRCYRCLYRSPLFTSVHMREGHALLIQTTMTLAGKLASPGSTGMAPVFSVMREAEGRNSLWCIRSICKSSENRPRVYSSKGSIRRVIDALQRLCAIFDDVAPKGSGDKMAARQGHGGVWAVSVRPLMWRHFRADSLRWFQSLKLYWALALRQILCVDDGWRQR